jgi:hypothetical protein
MKLFQKGPVVPVPVDLKEACCQRQSGKNSGWAAHQFFENNTSHLPSCIGLKSTDPPSILVVEDTVMRQALMHDVEKSPHSTTWVQVAKKPSISRSANLWYGLIANGFGNTSNGWSDRDFNHQRKELKIKAIPVIALPWTQN